MKKHKGIILLIFFVTFACDQAYEPLSNAVYFGEAQTASSKRVTVKEDGATASVYLSLATPSETNVVIELSNDAQVLEDFNKRNGTNYQLLPSTYYSLSSTQCEVEAGKLSSDLIDININAFDDGLEVSENYAIPVKIVSAKGVDVLKASDHMLILCDKIIKTKVLMTTGGNNAATTTVELAEETVCNSTSWTIEFLTYSDSYSLNGHNLSISGELGIFSRFGNWNRPTNEVQFNVGGIPIYGANLFEAKRWYHVALTCDGSTVRLYKDGELDLAVDSPMPNTVALWNSFTLRCGNPGALSEVRIWDVQRTQSEIANNMYAVNPKTTGLEIYWKLDDGAGASKAKDYTENGWDIPMMKGTWQEQSFPPEY